MFTAHIKYLGNLRTEATHLRSGNSFITDAPTDNQGRGEYFSPTDTVATGLGTCMLTLMGIAAGTHQIDMEGTEVDILKHMAANPRRISGVDVHIHFAADKTFTEKQKEILKRAALTCPVALSLHPDIEQKVEFYWPDEPRS